MTTVCQHDQLNFLFLLLTTVVVDFLPHFFLCGKICLHFDIRVLPFE